MADKQSVLFISIWEVPADELIRLVMGSPDTFEPVSINTDIDSYRFHIDNKYYSTDISLCSLKRKTLLNQSFASSVQGIVIYFDSSQNDSLRVVEGWLPFLSEYHPEIKMLVCKNCQEDSNEGCSKRLVQEWCIANGYELVEVEPIVDEEDADDDFPETTGVSRIIQALNAHVWPNLVMKDSKTVKPHLITNGNDEVDCQLSTLAQELRLEESLSELLECGDDFSNLFSQLPELKARVSAMQGTDRIASAVQIVEAFWKALDAGSSPGSDDDILDM